MLQHYQPQTTAKDELTNAFDLLDLEGNGDLELADFKLGLRTLNLNVTQEEAIQLFESIDTENTGYIDRDMFSEWLNKDSNSTEIEELRTRIREAISSQPVAIIDDEDPEIVEDLRKIVRKQSERHVS